MGSGNGVGVQLPDKHTLALCGITLTTLRLWQIRSCRAFELYGARRPVPSRQATCLRAEALEHVGGGNFPAAAALSGGADSP